MRGYLISFLMTCMLCNITSTWAAGVVLGSNCEKIACAENLYCTTVGITRQCVSCDEKTGHTHPFSDEGSTDIQDCYKRCETQQVTLGTRTPEKEKIFYPSPEECKYTLECTNTNTSEPNADGTACECKSTYIQSGSNICTGRCFTLTLDDNLESHNGSLSSKKKLYVKYGTGFFKSPGCTGTQLAPVTAAAPNTQYGWLIPNNIGWWQTFHGYTAADGTPRFGSDGKPVSGITSTTFESDTTLFGKWSANQYKVKYFDIVENTVIQLLEEQTCDVATYDATTPAAVPNGCKPKEKNTSNSGKTITGWSLTQGGTTTDYTFNTGDVQPNPVTISDGTAVVKLYAVWELCSKGYYCSTGKAPQLCPAGATSPAGSTKITQCHISNATQFSDGGVVFTLPLPMGREINYATY